MGLVTGPHARTPRTHSQWVVGPGRTPERTSGQGWESARPRKPHTQARGPPPPGRPHAAPNNTQSQLARARAVGLVTGSHARIPRTNSQWVVGPCRTPERTGGRGWESARPRTPHTQATGAPPGHPQAAPTTCKASSQERALWVCRQVPTPAPPASPASGKWAPAARLKGRAVGGGRVPDPGRPTSRQEALQPGALVPPPQRAKPARKSLRCGVGDGSPCPHPPHPEPASSGPRPHARKDEWSGVGERPSPDTPHPNKRQPPGRPRAVPTARKASSQERALWG